MESSRWDGQKVAAVGEWWCPTLFYNYGTLEGSCLIGSQDQL